MPGITTDQVNLYIKDMYKVSREGYNEEQTKHNVIFKVVEGATGAGDKVTQLLGAGTLTRHTTEDQEISFKSPVEGWQYYVKYWTYSDGIALSKNAVEDTVKLGNLIKELAATWGRQVRVCEEEMGALVFNKGGDLTGEWIFNGSHAGNTAPYGDMLYDNRPLFAVTANNHPLKIVAGTTASGTGTLYNSVASATLSPANFETIYILHTATNNRDERNQVIQNTADTLLTCVGADEFTAKKLLNSEFLPGGSLNDINPYRGLVTPISWSYLSATSSPFYVGKRGADAFQFHKRQKPQIDFMQDFDTKGYKASIDIRIGVLLKDWRVWTRGAGASAA